MLSTLPPAGRGRTLSWTTNSLIGLALLFPVDAVSEVVVS